MVKRYIAEEGSDLVRDSMQRAEAWFICRVGFVETGRAIGLVGGAAALDALARESSAFTVVELDGPIADRAVTLAVEHELRSLDAVHLAAAMILPREELAFATWDRRLHRAATAEGIECVPETHE